MRIRLENLTKRYQEVTAVDHFEFRNRGWRSCLSAWTEWMWEKHDFIDHRRAGAGNRRNYLF